MLAGSLSFNFLSAPGDRQPIGERRGVASLESPLGAYRGDTTGLTMNGHSARRCCPAQQGVS
jgi:hypothetical protein